MEVDEKKLKKKILKKLQKEYEDAVVEISFLEARRDAVKGIIERFEKELADDGA